MMQEFIPALDKQKPPGTSVAGRLYRGFFPFFCWFFSWVSVDVPVFFSCNGCSQFVEGFVDTLFKEDDSAFTNIKLPPVGRVVWVSFV